MKTIQATLVSLGMLTGLAVAKKGCTIFPNPISKTLEAYPDRIAVYGKVVKVEDQYSEFEVLDVIYGDVTPKSVIRVWDEKDLECNGKWDMGSEKIGVAGDSAIIIVPEIVDVKNGWDVIGDYRMPHLYGYHSIFRFVGDSSYYEDRLKGIELRRYTVPEFIGIVEGYFTSVSIRRVRNAGSNPIGYESHKPKKFDLNGKYLGRRDFPDRSMSVPQPH